MHFVLENLKETSFQYDLIMQIKYIDTLIIKLFIKKLNGNVMI